MTVISDAFTKMQDEQIREHVTHQIEWEPEVQSKDIIVKVSESNVTLTGFVHNYLEKTAAERAAKSVYGVASVANDIRVEPTGTETDPEIARDVVSALKLNSSIPNERIKVSVSTGLVTLEGSLEWNYQRENAEKVAHAVNGVRGVTNLLTIKPCVSTKQVKQRIEDAWRRTVDIDARSMSVISNGGTVSLYGHVHSWSEREQAERAAWQAPGVQSVQNHLVVSP